MVLKNKIDQKKYSMVNVKFYQKIKKGMLFFKVNKVNEIKYIIIKSRMFIKIIHFIEYSNKKKKKLNKIIIKNMYSPYNFE